MTFLGFPQPHQTIILQCHVGFLPHLSSHVLPFDSAQGLIHAERHGPVHICLAGESAELAKWWNASKRGKPKYSEKKRSCNATFSTETHIKKTDIEYGLTNGWRLTRRSSNVQLHEVKTMTVECFSINFIPLDFITPYNVWWGLQIMNFLHPLVISSRLGFLALLTTTYHWKPLLSSPVTLFPYAQNVLSVIDDWHFIF